MAITADWQFQARSLLCGDGQDTHLGKKGISGFGTPPVRNNASPRGEHGDMTGQEFFESRLLTLPVWWNGATPAATMQSFHAFKAQWRPSYLEEGEDELQVRLPGFESSDDIYRFYGKYHELEEELSQVAFSYVTAMASFLATDPLAYGPELSTAVDSSSPLTFTYNGTFPSVRFSLEVVGSGGTPVITSSTDLSVISFGTALGGGSTAVLDFRTLSLEVDGSPADEMLTTGPRWFRLLPGSNTITFTGCTSVQAIYQEAFV